MKILVTLPETNYYLWQMLVQINNLEKIGYLNDTIFLIGKRGNFKSDKLRNFINLKNGAKYIVFNDDREDKGYGPSLTANLIHKFFTRFPEYKNETFLKIDPDVIFTKKIDLRGLTNNDIWYMSDTSSYLNVEYIKSKSDVLFKEMCDVVGITPQVVIENNDNVGGAQILIKNNTPEFWKKVELDSVKLYQHMNDFVINSKGKVKIQTWTAEMWSLLWNAWLFNYRTKTTPKFDFAWATDNIEKLNYVSIYHNAGAVEGNTDLFVKGLYKNSPFNTDIKCSDQFCSARYVEEIKETEKNYSDILF